MIKYRRIHADDGPVPDGHKWICLETYRIYHKRYGKWEKISKGDTSDGATGAFDVHSDSWWGHDPLCKRGTFQDGSPCTAWMAARCLSDALTEEGRYFRAFYWHWATLLFGCKLPRKNGWFRTKNG